MNGVCGTKVAESEEWTVHKAVIMNITSDHSRIRTVLRRNKTTLLTFFFQFELCAARGCYHFTAVESVREGGAGARVGGVTSNRHILLLHSNNSECFWKEEIPWPGKTHHFTAEATNREVWTQWPWEQHTGFDCRSEANVKQSWNQSSVSKSWETFTNKSLTWRQKEKHHSVISWRDEE